MPAEIEQKWQKKWRDEKIFSPDIETAKKPYYALMMFPYPSAEGLHVGNMYPFTAVDIIAHFKRMQGYDVFEPIGLDAFGIHSENYAIKEGQHPAKLTEVTGKRFYEQLSLTGNSYDWTRTLETHRPEYYRWTQWVFIKLFKAGLALRRQADVNWCPSCKTVLADEQVIAGACERCSTQVVQKELQQWFFKITAFADKLLDGLDSKIWSERIRGIQKNWIGKSEGIIIDFDSIEVFTTRPETIDGATFVVVAPEHPYVKNIRDKEVMNYIQEAAAKSEIERKESREKTGVFSGLFVKHPVTGKNIPVWIADYVLAGYGTGAIMAVPALDERDEEFAKKFGLPILPTTSQAKPQGRKQVNYHLRDWLISRQRYWGPPIPIIYCEKCGTVPVPEQDLPVLLPETDDFRPTGTGKSPLASIDSFVNTTCPECGGKATRETDVSDNFLDSAWYFFRYPSIGGVHSKETAFDKKIVEKWLPVDIYIGGFEHAVLHLMYTRFVTMAFKQIGLIEFDEPFKRFVDNGHILAEGMKMSKSKGNVINPDDYIKEYGADTLRMYLMFLGPLTDGGDFHRDAIGGIYRFLKRVWTVSEEIPRAAASRAEKRMLNQTIKSVTADLETAISFNTPIARLMELVNFIFKQGAVDPETVKTLLKLLAPYAPHMTEELWEKSEASSVKRETLTSIHLTQWPEVEEKYLIASEMKIPVQVDGKVRTILLIPVETEKNGIVQKALSDKKVKKYVGERPHEEIYVPGKILNIVLK